MSEIKNVMGVLFLALLLSSCALNRPSVEVWMKDGRAVGQITTRPMPYGFECSYCDYAGHLLRLEKRDPAHNLLPGISVNLFDYDNSGRLIEERNCNGDGALLLGSEGYAIKKYVYSMNVSNNLVEDWFLQDTAGRAACGYAGYAHAQMIYLGSTDTTQEVFLEDEHRKPAHGTWDDVGGTAHVTYMDLQGIGAVRCGVYYDYAGQVISRKVLSGATTVVNSNNQNDQSGSGPGNNSQSHNAKNNRYGARNTRINNRQPAPHFQKVK